MFDALSVQRSTIKHHTSHPNQNDYCLKKHAMPYQVDKNFTFFLPVKVQKY